MAAVKRQIWQSKKAISNTNEVSGGMVLVSEFKDDPETPEAGIPDAPNDASAYVRSGLAWVVGYTKAAIDSLLGGKENTITATTSADVYMGDKTFQPAVNLPINTATQGALDKMETFIRSKANGVFGSHTGDTAETVLTTVLINGGEFQTGDYLTFFFSNEKTGTAGNASIRVRAGVTGTTSDNQIALGATIAATTATQNTERTTLQFVTGGNLRGFRATQSLGTDMTAASNSVTDTPINVANDWYLTFTTTLLNSADTVSLVGYRIGKIKSF